MTSETRKRKICVVTGGRAEYGILRWLIKDLKEDPAIDCSVVATGAHLVPEAGLTYRAIEADGIAIDRKVEIQLASDTAVGMTKSAGLALLAFADVFADLAPDIVVVLGDRYEICAVAMAAFLAGIPVAHISGGEVTEGAVDDALRHAITKFSRLHFVAAEAYRQRVIQLGEPPETVFNVGDPGIDNLHRLELLPEAETRYRLGVAPERPYLLVTYHPVTADGANSAAGMEAMLAALDAFPEYSIVLTRPNLDAGAREIGVLADRFAAERPERVVISTSLGQLLYLSAMKYCAAVVGNSSSGIVEAPALRRPTVDIGKRQKGRLKAATIVEATPTLDGIRSALAKALSPEFNATLKVAELHYGSDDASRRMHVILRETDLARHSGKIFHDIRPPE